MTYRPWHRAWRRPPLTMQLRLTALYGGLFLVVGALLLAITYGLFARQIQAHGPRRAMFPRAPDAPPAPGGVPRPSRAEHVEAFRTQIADALARQRADALHDLLVQSALALALVSVIALALGWIMAGRVLRPLRDITATARRLSSHNLDERINLRGPRDELKELADTFDAMLGRLAAAFEAQRRFVANASHELRTPLTVQRAAVDVALADPRPSLRSLRAMAERIRAATHRHERLIASLLALAQSERGIEHYEDADLADVLRIALTAAADGVKARGLRLTCRLDPVVVRGDPALLERLAANLLDNAVRYNAPDGWIDVRTTYDRGAVTLRVANSGPVVPPEVVATLFEPFRRHRTTTTDGHGLGLSIVSAITTAHRGSCAAWARPDGGLDIVITLPGSG